MSVSRLRSRARPHRSGSLALLLLITSLSFHALAQEPISSDSGSSASPEEAGAAPAAASTKSGAETSSATVPYTALFHETGAPIPGVTNTVPTPNPAVTADLTSGDSVSGHLAISGYNLSLALPPFSRAFTPAEAHLKLGPVYFRVDALSAYLIYSDETNSIDSSHRFAEINELAFRVEAQFHDDLYLAVQGTVYYLPIQNRAGFTTILNIPAALAAGLLPLFRAQVSYTTFLGDWPVTFADDLRFTRGHYSDSNVFNLSELHVTPVFTDREGDYTFGRPRTQNQYDYFSNPSYQDEFGILSNAVSASTAKDLGDWFFQGHLFHEDLEYFSTNQDLPTSRDHLELRIISERESLRFKPYASFIANHNSPSEFYSEAIRVGAFGPITDLMQIRVEGGAFISDRLTTYLASLNFDHTIGPNTSQHLNAGRRTSEFQDEISDSVNYNLTQVLGPELDAELFARYGRFTNTKDNFVQNTQERVGAVIHYTPNTRFRATAALYYSRTEEERGILNTYTAEMLTNYQITDTLSCGIYYRHRYNSVEDVPSAFNRFQRNEDLVFISVQKFFR